MYAGEPLTFSVNFARFIDATRRVAGGLKWTRTTDLALIRRAL